jgi:hypothetical protein
MIALVLLLTVVISSVISTPPSKEITYVSYPENWADQLAVKCCVGLLNRDYNTPTYVVYGAAKTWLKLIYNITNPTVIPLSSLLDKCFESNMTKHRYIKWNSKTQQALLPSIITLAGVLSAVPIDTNGPLPKKASVLAFDAIEKFKDFAPIDATQYLHQNHLNQTKGLVKLNPGYESQSGKAIFKPNITRVPQLDLVDYIVYSKLFNIYLTQGCLPFSKEHSLFKMIIKDSTWPRPIKVMGYDNTFVVGGGDLFEAETLCDLDVGMGQVASAGSANLAYWTRSKPVTSPLPFNPTPKIAYNSSKTYIAFLIGDGDNIDYLQGGRQSWIEQRLAQCNSSQGCQYPLLWTMSPHILYLAPDWAYWFANQLLKTEHDRFALPPSGHLYSYPELFPEEDQNTFVENTERSAQMLSTSITTDFEWTTRWSKSIQEWFPKYAKKGIIESVVTVNTPYMIPTLAFGKDLYKIVGNGNQTVVFKPHEWRGTRGSKIPFAEKENLNVSQMAAEINGYNKGSVTAIYLTSDGGGNLQDIDQLVQVLDEHVEVVGNNIGLMAKMANQESTNK